MRSISAKTSWKIAWPTQTTQKSSSHDAQIRNPGGRSGLRIGEPIKSNVTKLERYARAEIAITFTRERFAHH